MFTTNKHTQEILEILEPSPMPVHPYIAGRQAQRDDEAEKYLAKLGQLRSRRFDIEQHGDHDSRQQAPLAGDAETLAQGHDSDDGRHA